MGLMGHIGTIFRGEAALVPFLSFPAPTGDSPSRPREVSFPKG